MSNASVHTKLTTRSQAAIEREKNYRRARFLGELAARGKTALTARPINWSPRFLSHWDAGYKSAKATLSDDRSNES